MQLLFLFCTMLIVISEAFSQKLTTAPRSTSFKRKTSRFPKRLKNPFSRYMFSDFNVPLTSDYEITQYDEPEFAPSNQNLIKPYKYKRKYFTGEDNVNGRNFLKNNLQLFNERSHNSPQSFESYQFPGSGFRHFRKFNGLRKVREDNVKKRKHQCVPREDESTYRKNPTPGVGKLMMSLKKKHKRFSNYKRQCMSDAEIETEDDGFKPNGANVSASDDEKTDVDDFRDEKSEFDSPQGYSGNDLSGDEKSNSQLPRLNPLMNSNAPKFEHSETPKLYDLSSFENDNPAPGDGKKEDDIEVDEESRNAYGGNIGEDINKLKNMIVDLEKTIKEKQKDSTVSAAEPTKEDKVSTTEKTVTEVATLHTVEKRIETTSVPLSGTNSMTTASVIKTTTSATNTTVPAGLRGASGKGSGVALAGNAIVRSIGATFSRSNGTGPTKYNGTGSGKSNSSSDGDEAASKKPNERCNVDGTWASTTMKMDLIFSMQTNMMIKVKVKPFEDSEINEKWSLQGLALSKRGGPYIFAGLYPQKKAIVTFLGQCKISKEKDFIFGIWTLFHYSRKYTDLWKSVETKLDVLSKKEFSSEKKKTKEKKQRKKKEDKKEEKKT